MTSPNRIDAVLAGERRSALAEFFLMAVFFFFCAIFFTFLADYFFTILIVAVGLPLRQLFANSDVLPFSPWLLALLCVAVVAALRRDYLLLGEFNPRRVTLFTPINSENMLEAVTETATSMILMGPRCAVLAWRSAILVARLFALDLSRLRGPIEIALRARRKIRQVDLADVDIEAFLRDVDWLKGVAPLYAPPIGFVLTSDFRAALGADVESERREEESGWEQQQQRRRREDQQPGRSKKQRQQQERQRQQEQREFAPEPEPPEMSEREWALSVLGLSGQPTGAEITKAYRRLAKLYHPDVRKSPEAEARMKELNRAREVLR